MCCSRRYPLIAVTVILAFVSADGGYAQDPDGDAPVEKVGEEADHDALRELRAVAEKAINENDLELLRPYMAEQFSVVTYTDREFSDFDKFQERWQKTREELLSGGSYTTKLNPELSQIFGDIAVARGRSDNVLITGDGTRYEFPSRWTAVLHKVDGQWKVVRAHSSLSPFDNPMLQAAVTQWLVIVGVLAALVGVLVGGVFGLLIGRRGKKNKSPE